MSVRDLLSLDYEAEAERICGWLRQTCAEVLHKKGLVLGVSGGIDSSTCVALAVRALGASRVYGLLMPERDSSSESLDLGRMVCEHVGAPHEVEQIGGILEASGCYHRRDEAIRQVFPEYDESYKQKIVVPPPQERNRLTFFSVVIQAPDGTTKQARLPLAPYLQIVAATNFKQRTRKTMEYYHADRLNYGVLGTPNRLEYDQGFFVKGGDGLADIKPIAHLYKTQVYQLARHLGLPDPVVSSTPTTDTYSLPQGQDEFYFALPYQQMDLLLCAYSNDIAAEEVAEEAGLSAEQASWVYRDIAAKRRTTRYLHRPAQLLDPIVGVTDQH